MYHSTKKKIHILLHPELGDTHWDKILNAFIIILIILNVAAVMLETVQPIHDKYAGFFHIFDMVSVFIFTIEYILRVWSCNHDPKYQHSFHGRLRYMLSTEAIIDLIAILPFYIHVVVGLDLRAELVATADPAVDSQLKSELDASVAALQALKDAGDGGKAYDTLLAAGNAEGEALIMGAVNALVTQTASVDRAVTALGLSKVEFEGSDSLDNPNAVFQ